MYKISETVLPIYINGQCPIIITCSDVTLNLSSKDSSFVIGIKSDQYCHRSFPFNKMTKFVRVHVSSFYWSRTTRRNIFICVKVTNFPNPELKKLNLKTCNLPTKY